MDILEIFKAIILGIIQGINFDSKELKLSKGDIIVMVTDGATSSGTEWISDELNLIYNKNADQIAKKIIESAKKRSDPKHIDDITVLVSKLIWEKYYFISHIKLLFFHRYTIPDNMVIIVDNINNNW